MADTGRRRRQTAIPDPLSPGSWVERLATLGLPAAMLSWASLLAALIVLAAVQHSPELRAHYALSVGPTWAVALVAGVLAGAVVLAGRRRPGRLWPRLWALTLAALATLVSAAALFAPAWLPAPQLHALVTATLAGALALAPRLARLHPDSAWTQRIAPLSLLLTLALILPPALTGSAGATRDADHPPPAAAAAAVGKAIAPPGGRPAPAGPAARSAPVR